VREGEGLRVGDEVFETVRYLVDLGIFSKYVEILELRRQLDEVGEFCKVSEKPLGVEERFELVGELIGGGDEVRAEAGMLETKYGVFLGCANWFDVVMDVWEKQKDAEKPILVSALYIYLKPIVQNAEFVK
jgi:glycogen debranching enzyme